MELFDIFRRKIKLHGQKWIRSEVEESAEYYSQFASWEHKAIELADAWELCNPEGTVLCTCSRPVSRMLKEALERDGEAVPVEAPNSEAIDAGHWVRVPDLWDHEHCWICWWTISVHQSADSSQTGWYCQEEEVWVCDECYEKLLKPRLEAKHG